MTIKGLEIENRTDWDTKDLRKLIEMTVKEKGYGYYYKVIQIMTSKSGNYHGRASLHGNWIRMWVPKAVSHRYQIVVRNQNGSFKEFWRVRRKHGKECFKSEYCRIFDSKTFTQLFIHEWQHNQGLEHGDQANCWKFEVPWAKGFIVHPKEEKVKPKRDLVAERYANAQKKYEEHQKKLRKEKNLVSKWGKKVRYYERAIAKKKEVK